MGWGSASLMKRSKDDAHAKRVAAVREGMSGLFAITKQKSLRVLFRTQSWESTGLVFFLIIA